MSCLFHSLSAFVNGMNEDEVRQRICDYLESNPTLMEGLSLEDVLKTEGMGTMDYVGSMRNSSTWGGGIEIRAFCEIFRVGVLVHVRSTGRDILFRPSGMENAASIPAIKIEWQGAHYEPLPLTTNNSS